MKRLGVFFILNNSVFLKTVFFDRFRVTLFLALSVLSAVIYSLFPIITQFYVKYIYYKGDLGELIFFTIIFSVLYCIKLLVDIHTERYKKKFFWKIEKKIKEAILIVYSNNISQFIKTKRSLFTKHMHLYILLIKTIYNNFLDWIKIIVSLVIIFLFDKSLFIYFLFAIPFLLFFYFLVLENTKKRGGKKLRFEPDFAVLLLSLSKKSSAETYKFGKSSLEQELEQKLTTKTNHVAVNHLIRAFVNFYRLFYLAYFGFWFIYSGMVLENLLVGLLFLTILMKSVSNLILSAPFYLICAESFFKINSLLGTAYEKKV